MSSATIEYDTTAYDDIVAERAVRAELAGVENLVEELTGIEMPDDEGLGPGWAIFFAVVAVVFIGMSAGALKGNPIAGLLFLAIMMSLWVFLVNCAEEIKMSSISDAGNMFKTGPAIYTPEQREATTARREAVDAIIEHENPYHLLENLDDPDYVRTLREALRRDEEGWTMSD